ncbi:hypothetical protein [Mycobacterium sp.]|uniref:hypothetical protein n=1 Tax=Mycobacterium sp. TaxID=1785 RepID=UPI000CB2EAE8|nr:hypothetical protein [Mycobacterium sp.]PJE01901.1 MAG: hypothetical protein CK428_30600 [Mycobacterium sp.]
MTAQQIKDPSADIDSAVVGREGPREYSFAELLGVLGHVDDYRHEQTVVCWQRPHRLFTPEPTMARDAPKVVDSLTSSVPCVNVWFGVNPVNSTVTQGRGRLKDITRLTCLWADLDVKQDGCPDLDAAHEIITDVSGVLGERPCAITYSGHGLQPLWPLDRESAEKLGNQQAQQLSKRFGRLLNAVAARRGVKVDNVSDLTRVLRVPGTNNVKDPEHPVRVRCVADTGAALSIEQVQAALDDAGIEESPRFGAANGCGPQLFSRRALIKRVAKAPEGQRNRTLYGAAKDAARQGDLDTVLAGQLADAALGAGLTDAEVSSTITSAAHAEGVDIEPQSGTSVRSGLVRDDQPSQNDAVAEAAFWAQRPILDHIQQFARARGAAPYAVLGSLLRRAIDKVPPDVQLPPTVGAAASVNLFVSPVGRSGQGKDIANGVGRDAVVFVNEGGDVYDDPPAVVALGSGEGLARMFKGYNNDESPLRVNLEVPEVGTLAALAGRQGATLVGELLKAYMGQGLGFTNSQRSTTTAIPPHSYRLGLSVGTQPENAEFFLSREKDGLPQRFLWLPTIDPYAPQPTDEPPEVPAARVVVPTFPTIAGVHLIDVTPVAQRTIRQHRWEVLRGSTEVDLLDGHLMLTRLKVAFALALLESRPDISEEDWHIAGQLIELSGRVRNQIRDAVAKSRKRANTTRALDTADRQLIIDARVTDDHQRRVAKAIVAKLERQKLATKNELRKAVSASIRGEFGNVLDALLHDGTVVFREEDSKYALPS